MKKPQTNARRTRPRDQSKRISKSKLEELYPSVFRVSLDFSRQNEGSLEQPSPLKYVESNTTYGVFETPVR